LVFEFAYVGINSPSGETKKMDGCGAPHLEISLTHANVVINDQQGMILISKMVSMVVFFLAHIKSPLMMHHQPVEN
jgi:hypothetical protein